MDNEALDNFQAEMKQAKIASNMEIFKSIVNQDAMREMSRESYRAIMRWIREVQRVLSKEVAIYISSLFQHGVMP